MKKRGKNSIRITSERSRRAARGVYDANENITRTERVVRRARDLLEFRAYDRGIPCQRACEFSAASSRSFAFPDTAPLSSTLPHPFPPPPLHRSRSRVAVRGKGARKRALAVICFPSAYRQRPAAAMCQQRKVIFAYSFWSRRSRVGGGREGGREFRACVCCASSMLFGCASEIENLVWPRRRRRRRSPDAEIRKKTVGESRTPPELTTCHPLADSCRGRSLLGWIAMRFQRRSICV